MSENKEANNNRELGGDVFDNLTLVLKKREENKYNLAGWEGTAADLKIQVENGNLCPASSFAVVAEGMVRYKRPEERMDDDTDSMRDLAKVLSEGSKIYGQAKELNEAKLKNQIKKYVESHGGVFDDSINWQNFIEERSDRLIKKANAIDEANR
jgi:hypothetical protein